MWVTAGGGWRKILMGGGGGGGRFLKKISTITPHIPRRVERANIRDSLIEGHGDLSYRDIGI